MKMIKLRDWKIETMLSIVALLFNSCGVEGPSVAYDDIYVDDSQIAFEEESYTRQANKNMYRDERFSHKPMQYREHMSEQSQDEYTTDSVYNDTFDMDDYYDYAYTARLHRFHDPAPIYGYYDDFYTNMYWYDRDPMLWGTSIYFGYRWWWPSVSLSWGWGWHTWNHYAWYGDWYGWHHGWYGYDWGWGWYGMPHHGWAHNNWHNPWYYNSHDRNSNFYRPQHDGGRIARNKTNNIDRPGYRGEPTTTSSQRNGLSRNLANSNNSSKTFGDRYNERYASDNALKRASSNQTSSVTAQRPQRNDRNTTRTVNRLQRPQSKMNSNQSTTNRNLNQSAQKRSYTPTVQRQQRNSNVNRSTVNRNSSHSVSSPSRSSSSRSSSSFSGGSRSSSGSHSSGSMSRGGSRR